MTQVPPQVPMPGGMMRPHRGAMILVFGILGLVVCVIFGVLAWVMGNSDLQSMASGQMDSSGEGLTKAGKICGMISVILTLIGIVVAVLVMVFGVAAGVAGGAGGP